MTEFEPDYNLCCGCAACANVCPTKALTWTTNDEGFGIPAYDADACIGCGLCRKVCPYEHNHVGVDAEPQIFAATHKDEGICKLSSSGGAFTALSDWVLRQSGVVYGVRMDDAHHIQYARATTRDERNAFRGSKYAQCDGCDVFAQVVEDLKAGSLVLFTGTPCQVSGMTDYLRCRKVPTETLYTIDNICHGVASPMVWNEYFRLVDELYVKGADIEFLSMRSKRVPWRRQEIDLQLSTGDISEKINRDFSWNKLYLTTFATRLSCNSCRFTSYDRVGDISLADFWNYENSGLTIDDTYGVSLVLTNTEKGQAWLEACSSELNLQETDKKAAWQIHLERPLPASSGREKFWDSYRSDSSATIKKYARGTFLVRLKRSVAPILRKMGLYTLAARVFSKVSGNGKKH